MPPAKSVAELRAAFVAREGSVPIVTDGALSARYEDLVAQRATAGRPGAGSLADPAAADELLAEQIADLARRVRESTVTYRFRAIGRNRFRALLAEHPDPDPDGGTFNEATFPTALIAACSLDPVMSEADVTALGDIVSDGQWEQVWSTCWELCRRASGVPFS